MPIEREKIRQALIRKGFIEVSKNRDHDFFYLLVDGKKSNIFTKLSRGSSYKDYSDSLVNDVYKQIRLTKKQFLDYIECKLELQGYLQFLRDQQVIK